MTATTVLIATVSPSFALISARTPAAGAGISASTLSVEISNSGSSRPTGSPTFLSHLTIVPSWMLSPICGMITSTRIASPFRALTPGRAPARTCVSSVCALVVYLRPYRAFHPLGHPVDPSTRRHSRRFTRSFTHSSTRSFDRSSNRSSIRSLRSLIHPVTSFAHPLGRPVDHPPDDSLEPSLDRSVERRIVNRRSRGGSCVEGAGGQDGREPAHADSIGRE